MAALPSLFSTLNALKRSDLLGNAQIKRAAQTGDLGTAVIFDGPYGSGKKTAAAYAAAALLCRAPGDQPCGRCPSCLQAAAGSHPDILFYDVLSDENHKIKNIRELRSKSFIRPSQSPFKVFILNRADLLTTESQNALLKVLEEPTSTVFILTSENAMSLLQTIRSRCRTYALEPLSPAAVEDWISAHPAGDVKYTPSDLRTAAQTCGGAIGQALLLLEKGLPKPAKLAQDFVASLSGSPLRIMEICLAASALTRSEYGDFYTATTEQLTRAALREPNRARYYVSVYEYIQQQKDKLTDNNGSVFALSSQLAAFCGTINRSK